MNKPERPEYIKSRLHRWISGLFGVFFIIIAVTIGILADAQFLSLLCVSGLAALGLDSVAAALQNRRSILSMIGPLP